MEQQHLSKLSKLEVDDALDEELKLLLERAEAAIAESRRLINENRARTFESRLWLQRLYWYSVGDMTDTLAARQVDGSDSVGGEVISPCLVPSEVSLMARRSPRKDRRLKLM
ncbi:hypothetical protein ACVJGD_007837 [Bradyrhizobium sp. USDA 10063]